MFKLFICGRTPSELKDNIVKAYDELVNDPLETEAASLGYSDEPVAPVDTHVAQPVSGSPRDTRGVPWHPDLHSENQSTTKDGAWRGRRNGDKEALRKYENEFLGRIVKLPENTVFDVSKIPDIPATPPQAVAPVQPAQPPAVYENIPVPEGSKPAHSLESFKKNLVMTIAGLIRAKKINQEYVDSIVKHFKVSSIADLGDNEANLKQFFDSLVQYGFITKVD